MKKHEHSPGETSESTHQLRIEKLASEILLHKKLYYSGKSIITDAQFDQLEEELRALDPHHPVLSMVGYPVSGGGEKVRHDPPMLSLEKSYDPEAVLNFLRKFPCVCMDKLDGMAMCLEYSAQGELFRASTRGSGQLGENVTEHIFHVSSIPKHVKAIRGATLEVRGEVFFPTSAFPRFSEQFDSYRNAVPGTFGRKEVAEAVPVLRELGFCAYDVILRDAESGQALAAPEVSHRFGLSHTSFLLKMTHLEDLGFYTGVSAGIVEKVSFHSADELQKLLEERFARTRDYQIDGLVFRCEDDAVWEAQGVTSHHPRGSLAFKQTGETAVTRILAIEENVGRSGKITFRAKLEPVYLSGAKISYATLHNAEFIEAGHYAPGARVLLKRSGEVIPSIIGLEEAAPEKYKFPQTCLCGSPVVRRGPDLFCQGTLPCAYRDQESLVHFVHALDMLGISDKIILKMREAGLVQVPGDLFRLTREDVLQLEGFGEKSADNVISVIQSKRKLPLAVFLTALGLARGGVVKCKEVAQHFKTLDAVRSAEPADLAALKGWADKSAEDFLNSLREKAPVVDDLLQYVKVQAEHTPHHVVTESGHPLAGKSVCITGSLSHPRESYRTRLEAIGAKLVESVSSKTDLLVCNEPSSSSKYKKAQELGIKIITEHELVSHYHLPE